MEFFRNLACVCLTEYVGWGPATTHLVLSAIHEAPGPSDPEEFRHRLFDVLAQTLPAAERTLPAIMVASGRIQFLHHVITDPQVSRKGGRGRNRPCS